jgi:tryptophanyl-tRNA synthetase
MNKGKNIHMLDTLKATQRVVSGQRTTGACHIGHYFGVLKNWIELQHHYECWFMLADLHALTTHYQEPWTLKKHVFEQVIDWLSCGLDPKSCQIFLQSEIQEHAELASLLGMITPLSWLERVPTYKEQLHQLQDREIHTYGFLGYPVLMSADICLYRANFVPVGEDQLPHLELTRELVRKFNHLFGTNPQYQSIVNEALDKMGRHQKKTLLDLKKTYQETGSKDQLETAKTLISSQAHLSHHDREYLLGFVEGAGRMILVEPQALLTPTPKICGLDGNRKMSKSYGNVLNLRENPKEIPFKIKNMPTDPARIRRTDPGEPTVCPVFTYHALYRSKEDCADIAQQCRTAAIGCVDCKSLVAKAIIDFHAPIYEKGLSLQNHPSYIYDVIRQGSKAAKEVAAEQMKMIKESLCIGFN